MRAFIQTGMDAAAKALGMTVKELQDQLRAGKSLKDIADAKGVDFSKVQTAITDAVKPALDQAVANGQITSKQATDLLARLTSGDAPVRHHRGQTQDNSATAPASDAFKKAIDAAASTLKIDASALLDQLRAGKSLKDVAAANGVDFSVVQKAITDALGSDSSQASTYSVAGGVSQTSDSGLVLNTAV
jgi:hypothetical protein